MANSTATEKSNVAIKNNNKWKVDIDSSKIDDSQTVILTLDSSKKISGTFKKTTPTMVLRCENNKTNVYITTDVFLGSETIQVKSRLDNKNTQKQNWRISKNHKAMLAKMPISFIKKLMKHEKLSIEFEPYRKSKERMEFDIQGLTESIKPLREACYW